ncbi:MAG: hypothetical protein JHC26_04920 [Thermofilum sp.]|jgi:hypothetical protein|uniref:hypothetical protein n=1 Tax=Thermofilum sp. TaxID=1961369 RepID=UPI00258A66EB|nr:hypothetical protein [Thermofilum sp.]MCI4408411.1 hypothetical protein [Thermofilum sp.]
MLEKKNKTLKTNDVGLVEEDIMARLKEIEDREAVIFYIQKQYAEQLRKLAMQHGMTLSEFMRIYVIQFLNQLNHAEQQANAPSHIREDPTKPIHLLELKELEASLDTLEDKVIKLEQKVQLYVSLGGYGQAPAVKYEEIEQLREMWHKKKRWFYSFYKSLDPQDVAPVVQRLVKLKERIENAYNEYLRLQRGKGTIKKNDMVAPATR